MVRGQPDPRDAQAHHPRPQAAGRRGQPRGRRDREVRGKADRRRAMTVEATQATRPTAVASAAGPTPQLPQTMQNELIMQNIDEELFAAVPLDDVVRAIKDIADGRPVVVVDAGCRE